MQDPEQAGQDDDQGNTDPAGEAKDDSYRRQEGKAEQAASDDALLGKPIGDDPCGQEAQEQADRGAESDAGDRSQRRVECVEQGSAEGAQTAGRAAAEAANEPQTPEAPNPEWAAEGKGGHGESLLDDGGQLGFWPSIRTTGARRAAKRGLTAGLGAVLGS